MQAINSSLNLEENLHKKLKTDFPDLKEKKYFIKTNFSEDQSDCTSFSQEKRKSMNTKKNKGWNNMRSEKDCGKKLENLKKFLESIHSLTQIKINSKLLKENFKIDFKEFPKYEEILSICEKIIERLALAKYPLRNWYELDITYFLWIIINYCCLKLIDFRQIKNDDWDFICDMIPGKTSEQCKFKFLSLIKLNLQEFPWSIEEDNILKDIIKEKTYYKWGEIAKELYEKIGCIIYRPAKFCRERWNNYLDPDLKKGEWKIFEDVALLNFVLKNGKKWSDLSRNMKGRTENAVKNRFNSLIKQYRKKSEGSSESDSEFSNIGSQNSKTILNSEIQIIKYLLSQKNFENIQKKNSVIMEEKSLLENDGIDVGMMKDEINEDEKNKKFLKNNILLSDLNLKLISKNQLKEIISGDFGNDQTEKSDSIKKQEKEITSDSDIEKKMSKLEFINLNPDIYNYLNTLNSPLLRFNSDQKINLNQNFKIKEEFNNRSPLFSSNEQPNFSFSSFTNLPQTDMNMNKGDGCGSPNDNLYRYLSNYASPNLQSTTLHNLHSASFQNLQNLNSAKLQNLQNFNLPIMHNLFDECGSFKNISNISNLSSYTNFSFDNSSFGSFPSQNLFNFNNVGSFKIKYLSDVNLNNELNQGCFLQQAIANFTKKELYLIGNHPNLNNPPLAPNSPENANSKLLNASVNNCKKNLLKMAKMNENNNKKIDEISQEISNSDLSKESWK